MFAATSTRGTRRERNAEDRHALLRGLFLTGFLADEFFADELYSSVEQVIVLSASSKTAIGFAQRAAEREDVAVVGVTSASNAELVASLGYYDSVVAYDAITSIERVPSVLIDMSGNTGLVAAVHDHLDEELRWSMALGKSHHDSAPATVDAGPPQKMFFAPGEVTRRIEEWGQVAYAERMTAALRSFVEGSASWLSIERSNGPEPARQAWADVRDGRVAPSVGRVVSLHPSDGD